MSLLRRDARRSTDPPGEVLGPDAVEIIGARTLRVGDDWCRTLAVTGYPREVGPGWLQPLCDYPGPIEVAVHIEPIPTRVASDRLRRQRARLRSTQAFQADHGRLEDLDVEAAAEDAEELSRRVARGEGRLFELGIYITIRGWDPDELEAHTEHVCALLDSLLLTAHPATYRTLQGWLTTEPYGQDLLKLRRTLDTESMAASFPFASGELASAEGVLYGSTPAGGLVLWDRFAQHNYNSVILAHSGAGKSYLAKLELLRSLYRGIQATVIDPEDEYRRLAEAVGGRVLRLGAPEVRLNPFDLDTHQDEDAFGRQCLFIHTLINVLVGELDPATTAALDRGIIDAYHAAGISSDPRTHRRPVPLLGDLAEVLDQDPDPAARALAARLAPYTTGTHRRLFAGPTTTRPGDSHLVVFSLKELPEELAAAGTLLTLDAIWRQVSDPAHRTRRLVLVDEAWLLMQHAAGARFLYRLAKAARKHHTGLTVVTQDAADLLGSELGQAVVNNADTRVLLHQAPHAIDALTSTFKLSEGERMFLLSARRGEALLSGGSDGSRVAFYAEASPEEHQLITTDPVELAAVEAPPARPRVPATHRPALHQPGSRRRRRR